MKKLCLTLLLTFTVIALFPSSVFAQTPIPGDLNHDNKVDILDLRLLWQNFTNIFDYNLLVGNFGKSTGAGGTTVGKYEVFELTYSYPTAGLTNPWEDVVVSGTFHTPSGKQHPIDGFYYDIDTYKVRFTPAEVGPYSYSVSFAGPVASENKTYTGSFTSQNSTNKGFIRRQQASPYRLVYEDGAIFNGIGLNDCWSQKPAPNYPQLGPLYGSIGVDTANKAMVVSNDDYFKTYGKMTNGNSWGEPGAGMNIFRWNPGNCSFGIFQSLKPKSQGGNFYSVGNGKLGDTLIQNARANGFSIMFALFFVNPSAFDTEAAQRFYRYVLARFGPYVDIWEICNECEPDPPDDWLMNYAAYIRSFDPYKRMVTNSLPRGSDYQYLDVVSPHIYQPLHNAFTSLSAATNQWTAGLPVVAGEVGNGNGNWDPQSAARMRMRSWTAFIWKGVLVFWNTSWYKKPDVGMPNQYLGTEERGYIRVLQQISSQIPANATSTKPTSSNGNVTAYGLRSGASLLVYFFSLPGQTTPLTTSVSVNVPISGTASWINPKDGSTIQTFSITSGAKNLTTPSFTEDIALFIK